ncbi:MAG: diaminopimelate decarboxylase [Paenibacillus sp.]|uniref:Uncharacterized protein n=1 Tax=Paenibacillus aquistagni TaxID=1852522 RepID=A0A1X7K9B5_9BACL|nr:hypothetical protein [Paenibacillus aquistagni]MBR2569217.1 diaminopimelate decarboxylase [Paenibacillus sp.]NMM53581.1 diaminopimelate decarboxylase [Paenibacillus aquistagni]SMG37393.1 hypothetical protein SAMN06295960_2215 [Paenibacillus aquistagni]
MNACNAIYHPSLSPVYCIGCSSQLTREQSKLLFRTGYVRVGMPLGACESCIEKNETLRRLWTSVSTDTSYDYLLLREKRA